jgi:hypothetical protein
MPGTGVGAVVTYRQVRFDQRPLLVEFCGAASAVLEVDLFESSGDDLVPSASTVVTLIALLLPNPSVLGTACVQDRWAPVLDGRATPRTSRSWGGSTGALASDLQAASASTAIVLDSGNAALRHIAR